MLFVARDVLIMFVVVVARCSLFVVRCSLCVVRRLLLVVCSRSLFVVC